MRSREGAYCHMAGPVKRRPAPQGSKRDDTPAPVGRKTVEDLEAEARVRAHLRQQMEERHISRAELARRIGSDDGNMTRLLNGTRGVGLGLVVRICRELSITPTRLLLEDPQPKYWDSGQKNDVS